MMITVPHAMLLAVIILLLLTHCRYNKFEEKDEWRISKMRRCVVAEGN